MNIQYYGDYCFKITAKPQGRATEDVVLITDMPEKVTGLRSPQGEADIVLLSHRDETAPELSLLKGEPLVFSTPGEYAAKGVSLIGIPSFRDAEEGVTRGQNTIFLIHAEDLHLCFLGALGHDLSPDVIGRIGNVDILFAPAAGTDTLPIGVIDDVIRKIEPSVVIPMHYAIPGMASTLPDVKKFCDAVGNCPEATVSRYNVKKKDLEGKNMEVVLLSKD